jgi:Contractile injection system tube protein
MGELSKGRLVVAKDAKTNDESKAIEFMFNPTEYSISKTNAWTTKANKGKNVPKYEFPGGEPRELKLDLFFDSYLVGPQSKRRDLWLDLNRLFNFMMIDKSAQSKGPHSGMSQPPKCRLEWGKQTKHLSFECYVTSCTVKYTMFDETGIPIRATANLTLKEAMDSESLLPTNPTSLGEPGRRRRVVAQGDRLDLIAFQEYGDAGEWRRLAEANHLHNPLALRPGMTLAVPPR